MIFKSLLTKKMRDADLEFDDQRRIVPVSNDPRFVTYFYGTCPFSGRRESRMLESDTLTRVVDVAASSFEHPGCDIILNGHTLDLEELRRWALITEGCQL